MWFNHPKPVGSRKPVAALVQQHSDPEPLVLVHSQHQTPFLHEQDAATLAPIEFSVRYGSWEYAAFMWQHAGYLIRRRRIAAPASWYMRCKSTWSAAWHFFLQGRSRTTYQFTIDRHGIVRSGPAGVTLIAWDDVVGMRSYPRGRMLLLKRGTLPLPARCLDAAQSASLAGYATWIRTHP
ncbi:YcxB family protein [Massilia sp. DWR3-1-1]|uniref:YcxB family protein n=1 Tax=Massilia sp. DWR3-1-1 TaxID=2804559 RepID=UPI003CED6243